jgi:hypothetical protein
MKKRTGKWMVIGGLAGILLWLYDHSFFITGGTERSPISNAILNLADNDFKSFLINLNIGREGIVRLFDYLVPLLVLIFSGAALGAATSFLASKLKR